MYRTPARPDGGTEIVRRLDSDLRPSKRAPPLYSRLLPVATVATTALLLSLGIPPLLAIVSSAALVSCGVLLADRLLAPRRAREFNAALAPALEAMSRGDLDRAEGVFRTLFTHYRGRPGLQVICLFDIAATRTRRGDIEGALRILMALDAFGPTKGAAQVAVRVPCTVALHLAQLGRVEEARRWLTDGRARKSTLKYTANVEAVILTREGQHYAAEAAYAREWPDLERALTAVDMRSICARRAFNLETLGADEAAVQRLVQAARSDSKTELVHVGAGWPEIRAFLERHDLV